MRFLQPVFSLVCFLAFLASARGESPRVIATGDSLTGQYWFYLPQAFTGIGHDATVPDPDHADVGSINTSYSGLNSIAYTGKTTYEPGGQPIDYGANVMAANPDVICFMLGINDLGWGSDVSSRFEVYKANLGPVFDEFAKFKNSKGQTPKVIIGSILPFDVEKNNAYWTTTLGYPMERQFDVTAELTQWNAWLQQEALQHNLTYLDNFTEIQQVPDWKTTLMAPHDGLHLSPQGSSWIASQFANAAVVPEPSTLVLLLTAAGGWFLWRRR